MKLSEAAALLAAAGIAGPMMEARQIFSEIGGIPRAKLFGCDPEIDSEEITDAVNRRSKREPLQYIIGRVDFYRESYKVTPDVLIPRQDTEILVDYAVHHLPAGASFVDLCTGSGCVAISTLKNTQGTRAVCVDISEKAAEIARINRDENRVSERLSVLVCDALEYRPEGEIFAMLSNPPYVTEEAYAKLERELEYEPRLALVGEENGLIFYKRLTPIYKDIIPKDGFIAYEIGYDQGEALMEIAKENRMRCQIIKDLGGNDRVAVLTH